MNNNLYQYGTNHHGFINPSPVGDYGYPTFYRNNDGHNKGYKLATIYVKPQVYNGITSPINALKQGTAFAELYSPFSGKGGIR